MERKLSVLGLLSAASAVASVWPLVVFGERGWRVLDIGSHFRVPYVVGLAGLGLVFTLSRRWMSTGLTGPVALEEVDVNWLEQLWSLCVVGLDGNSNQYSSLVEGRYDDKRR
jgi:hypothetical protein